LAQSSGREKGSGGVKGNADRTETEVMPRVIRNPDVALKAADYVDITGGPHAGKAGQLYQQLSDGRWLVRFVNDRSGSLWRIESDHLRKHGTKRNPDVARKPGASIVSEQNALGMIRQLAADIVGGGTTKEARDNAATIVGYCDVLLGQVKSGVHANPSLVTFMAGNPMVTMSHDVQAVMYRHKQDGDFYIHTFGGKEVPIREGRGGRQVIYLDELPARTGVDMRSDKHVVVMQRPDGKPISDDF
jgi:hypothetical protein